MLVLVALFPRWSVPWRCNGGRTLVSGLDFSPWRVIQCPSDATVGSRTPGHMTLPPWRASQLRPNGLTPIWLQSVTPLQ
uniref:Secreted protein n=1 Tax=Mesocestoides corti TaxID=53468 RepID=A0A5K3FZR2_MESCO